MRTDKQVGGSLLTALLIAAMLWGCSGQGAGTNSPATLYDLRVEYSEKPLGIDVTAPRFSWKMSAPAEERGYFQSAYRILVTDPGGGVMWDSEERADDISLGIPYAGKPLQAATRYDWTVTVRDQDGAAMSESAWFETGLMSSGDASDAWEGAQWIGGGDEDLVLFSHYLSVFKLQYTLRLDRASGCTRAGFVYGANDARLMDENKNIYNIESGEDESYIRIDFDTRRMDESEGEAAELVIYRAGYDPDDDPEIPLKRFDIPPGIVNPENRYEHHTVYVESVFGTTRIFLDVRDDAHEITGGEGLAMGPFSSPGVNLNPVGSGGDYISFPMLADIGFAVPAGQSAAFSDIRVRHYRSPGNTLFEAGTPEFDEAAEDIFMAAARRSGAMLFRDDTGYMLVGGKSGAFISADPSRNAMPMLRKRFGLEEKKIQSARLYVTARGIYEIYLNGSRVGSDWFNPGLTQYNVTHLYQTYDVTDLLRAGEENVLGVQLGEGWWSGNITFTGGNWNYFGDRQSLLARLVVSFDDGTRAVVATGEEGWKYFGDGPVRYGSFFQGEVYDATRETAVAGWSEPGFDDAAWKPAVVVPLEGAAYTGTSTGMDGAVSEFNFDGFSLTGQVGENVRVVKTLTAESVEEVRPGVYVYDMGQNMVGVPRIQIDGGSPGQEVTLRYAETLYPDLPEYGENIGMVMLENIRAALAQDIHILKGGADVIGPRFTFHGYRYLEITGMDTPPSPESVKGLVLSSVSDLTAIYESSNPKVNRLWENIVWSMRGNFLSIPTDCPQRNERMGWSGDLSVFSRTATYLSDVDPFLTRHMTAMRDAQLADGSFTDVAPMGGGFGGILWGSAGITVAWEAYQQYGDEKLLRDHYDAMGRYMRYLAARIDPETGVMKDGPLGDWLSPEGNKNDSPLLWCAYYVYDLDIMARAAEILGKADDAEAYREAYEKQKRHFNEIFVDPETGKTITSGLVAAGFGPPPADTGDSAGKPVDTQTSYAVPLALGVFSEENAAKAARHLAEACIRENRDDDGVMRPPYSLMTGFMGTAWISKALSENGYSDIAYRLLQQESYPSWLYPVTQGATTIWERLNSYTAEEGFGGNNSMNSFNHYSFGAVGQWLMANSLGIGRDEESPGFKHFILKPEPDPTGEMTFAGGGYDSMYGSIESRWRLDGGTFTYTATVPANTTATLYLPGAAGEITEGGSPAGEAPGVTFIEEAEGRSIYRLASGTYVFDVN